MNQPLRIGLIGAGMVSRHHLIAWASIPDQARIVAIADPSSENAARRTVEHHGSYDRTIAHFVSALRDNLPFETAPPDNLQTLRLVEDCYRLSGWEALR